MHILLAARGQSWRWTAVEMVSNALRVVGEVVGGCGHVHHRREVPDREGLRRGCPVRAENSDSLRFLHSSRGVSEHETFLQRRRALREARAAASLTHSSTTASSGFNDDGNGTAERNQGAVHSGVIGNTERANDI